MSKALSCPVILSSASTRADGSVGIRLSTPELKPEEKTAIFELQGLELTMFLKPADGQMTDLVEVKSELEEKTPSQRLRAVLFLLWKQQADAVEFEQFYRQKMNGIIEHLKLKLNPT